MSITSRINEMSSHIEQAYDELQGLGADLTNVNKNIENISMVLDDIYDSMPQVSGEGTSLTLDDTRVGKIKSTLKGNTSQTTYSGKNLFDKSNYVDNYYISSTGELVAENGNFASYYIPVSSGNYIISGANAEKIIRCAVYDSNQTFIRRELTTVATSLAITISNDEKYVRVSGYKVDLNTFQLEKNSSATPYEPYVGGTTSPNPSYPQPINVVSGDNKINVAGKNLIPTSDAISTTGTTSNGITLTRLEDGTIKANGTATAGISIYLNNNYTTLPAGTYTLGDGIASGQSGDTFFLYADVQHTDGSAWEAKYFSTATTGNRTRTIEETFRFKPRIVVRNGQTLNNVVFKPMLEVGSSATTYEAYQGNTYNIDLPDGMELCKIGNYQDYFYKDSGKWYLHKEIKKIVLNGSESFSLSKNTSPYVFTYVVNDYKYVAEKIIYCNYFEGTTNGILGTMSNGETHFRYYTDGNFGLYFCTTDYSNTTDFTNWVSTHNIIAYYVLATPTNTEITYEPLITQLNLLEKAMSKDGQTNISQVNNDLPFIISASALKERQESLVVPDGMKFANSTLSQFTNLNTAQVTDMSYMFMECSSLTDVGEIDTSLVTDMSYMFQNCRSLESIPNLDTSNVTSMSGMFAGCEKIVNIPHLDTSNVTDMTSMFLGCYQLENIPILNTANVISMTEMFSSCDNLSDNSLNNILAMCANAINYEETKILSNDDLEGNVGLGLNQEQIEKCKTLSNYQAFLNAGWKAV